MERSPRIGIQMRLSCLKIFRLFTIASKNTIVARYSLFCSFVFLKVKIRQQHNKLQIPPHKTSGIKRAQISRNKAHLYYATAPCPVESDLLFREARLNRSENAAQRRNRTFYEVDQINNPWKQ